MKILSSLEIVTFKVNRLHTKKSTVCSIDKSNQALKTNLQSKNQPVSLDNDTFSILSNLETFLQKDINHFQVIANSFDCVDKNMSKTIKERK